MTVVVVVALAGLVALLVAILTDNTFVALAVVALAGLGIVLLLRDWRVEHRKLSSRDATADGDEDPDPEPDPVDSAMTPEMFAPDISTDGTGPSSDARAD